MRKVVCTITPNPALDLSGIVDSIKPNEKNYIRNEQRYPGGNAINAARILKRLGVPVVASGFLGGSTGSEIFQLLKAEELKQHFIQIKESSRINITVSSDLDHHQTRLSFVGPKIKKSEKTELFDYIEKQNNISLLVFGGSLPPGFTPADVIHLVKLARKKNIDTVIDCPGNVLSQVLTAKPLLIKPNLEEFQTMLGSNIKTVKSVIREAKSLLSMVRYICVSSVEGGAILVTHQGCYFGKVPDLKVRSTVGAGDSMVGAMVAQLYSSNTSPAEILRWGLASAAATLSQSGTSLGQASEIVRLYKKTRVENI